MSGLIQESIDRKRQEAIKTGVALMKLLTPSEADLLREQRRQAVNASARRSYARNRDKEISDQIRKQKTPEGKAAKLYFNSLARARRWGDKELESALLDEKAQKGKAALVDVPAIMRRLERGNKWRVKPVAPVEPKQPREKRPSKAAKKIRRENNGGTTRRKDVAWSDRPASDKQRAFLTDLGVTFSSFITDTDASELISEAMETSPVTLTQSEKLERLGFNEPLDEMTAADASAKINELSWKRPTPEQLDRVEQLGFTIRSRYRGVLDDILKLDERPPSSEQLDILARYGMNFYPQSSLDALFLINLARTYERIVRVASDEIPTVCCRALADPEFITLAVVVPYMGMFGGAFATSVKWPTYKKHQWLSLARC